MAFKGGNEFRHYFWQRFKGILDLVVKTPIKPTLRSPVLQNERFGGDAALTGCEVPVRAEFRSKDAIFSLVRNFRVKQLPSLSCPGRHEVSNGKGNSPALERLHGTA